MCVVSCDGDCVHVRVCSLLFYVVCACIESFGEVGHFTELALIRRLSSSNLC